MAQLFRNNAFSSLAASLTNIATTLTVTTGHGDRFPAVTAPDFFHLTLQDSSNNIEIVRVTARTAGADSMTITRAQEGTTARSWNIGDVAELRITAFGLNPLALFEGGSTATALRTSLGLGTSATVNTGTSGAVIPLLNGNNTHGGTNTFSGANTFTAAQTFRAADAIRVEAALNQDAIVLRGRAGGTGGFAAVVTPATLAATRIYTMPDAGADANFVMSAGTQTLTGSYTFSNTITGAITGNAGTVTNGVYTTGDQTIGGAKRFSGSIAVGGSAAPAVNLDVQTTGSQVLTSLFTTGITDVNFRVGAMSGVTGGTAGTNMGRLGLFYIGTGEVATIEFRRGATSTDGSFAFRTAGNDRATLDNSGNFVATGNVTAFSDIRLKTDLTQIGDALAKVKALTGYTYTRTDTGERQTGLVAQDVQAVLPEAVIEGEHLSLAYGNLMGLMVEAIKELEARVKELEAR